MVARLCLILFVFLVLYSRAVSLSLLGVPTTYALRDLQGELAVMDDGSSSTMTITASLGMLDEQQQRTEDSKGSL